MSSVVPDSCTTPWSRAFYHSRHNNLIVVILYAIYNVDCDAALIVPSGCDEQSNNTIAITMKLKSV